MSYLLGLDIGTTSIKSIIFNSNGEIVSSALKNHSSLYNDKKNFNWLYMDPEKLWLDCASAIKSSLKKINPPKIKSISVTGLGAEGLPLDKEGNCVYPAIFFDKRCNIIAKELKNNFGSNNFFNIAGKQILPMDTLLRILWLKQNEPQIFSKADTWLLIVDYINFKLCGNRVTDYSMASCTGLFEIKKGTWAPEILDYAGINLSLLPQIFDSGEIIGYINKESSIKTGLAEGTPVVIGGHDFHCAAFAAGSLSSNKVTDIIGTWEITVSTTNNNLPDEQMYNYGLALERTVIKNKYTLMASNVAADMLEWFKENFGFEEKVKAEKTGKRQWDLLDNLAESSSTGSNGLFFLPHFFGSNSPQIDNLSLGAFLGLHRDATKADIIHSIIEGLNYQSKAMLDAIEKIKSTNAIKDNIVAVGGGTRNKLLMQTKANILGKIIEVPLIKEATALGAAIFAGIGTGIYKNERNALEKTIKEKIFYYPDENASKVYDQYFKIYQRIYKSLKNLNKDINKLFH